MKDSSSLNGSTKKEPPTSTVYSGGTGRANPKLSGLKFAGHKSGGHMRKHGSPSRVLGDFQMQIVNKAFADFWTQNIIKLKGIGFVALLFSKLETNMELKVDNK